MEASVAGVKRYCTLYTVRMHKLSILKGTFKLNGYDDKVCKLF